MDIMESLLRKPCPIFELNAGLLFMGENWEKRDHLLDELCYGDHLHFLFEVNGVQ
jgi:hypothetical protein